MNKEIKVEKRSDKSVYITIGNWVVYLDNSTDEKIIDSWVEGEKDDRHN
jgi:hypothetical protein